MKLFDLRGLTLLTDREYIGKDWFKFLKDNEIRFVIRMRKGDYVEDTNQCRGKSYDKMYCKCCLHKKLVRKQVFIGSEAYTLIMMPNPKESAEESVLIFLTTLPVAKQAAELYVQRWKIECLFKRVKTNGYNLEDLNLRDKGKSLLMLAIVIMAYALAIVEGRKRKKGIPKQHYPDGAETLAVSIFREGLAILTPICFNFIKFITSVLGIFNTKNHSIFKNV